MSITSPSVAPGDTPLKGIAEEVQSARKAILAVIAQDTTREWRPRQLIDAAKANASLSTTPVSIAFWNLVEAGELEVDERLVVHALGAA